MKTKLYGLLENKKFLELVRYALVGGLTTLVNMGLFFLLDKRLGVNTTVSNVISVISSVIFAYAANKLFVFKSKSGSLKALALEMLSFFSARGATMLLEVGGLLLLNGLMGVDSMVSKVILNVLVIVLNYVLSKLFVFKNGGS